MSDDSMILIRGMIVIGVMLIIAGVIVFCLKKKRELEISILLGAIGLICTVASVIMNFIVPSDAAVAVLFLFVFGGTMLGGGIIGFLKRARCNVEVEGTVMSIDKDYRGQIDVKFRYHYNDVRYDELAVWSSDPLFAKGLYTEKQKVTLNIDPKMPTRFYDKRRFPMFSVVLTVIGGLTALLFVISIIGLILI